MTLSDKEARFLSDKSEKSVQLVRRVFGSLRIHYPPLHLADGDEAVTAFDIGLRLEGPLEKAAGNRTEFLSRAGDEIRAYASSCPQVFQWIASGEFSTDSLPDAITKARLLHATRTVGRLRAKILRNSGKV